MNGHVKVGGAVSKNKHLGKTGYDTFEVTEGDWVISYGAYYNV